MRSDPNDWSVHEVQAHQPSLMRNHARVWPHRLKMADIDHDASRVSCGPAGCWLRRSENLSQARIAAVQRVSQGSVEEHRVRAAGSLSALPCTVGAPVATRRRQRTRLLPMDSH